MSVVGGTTATASKTLLKSLVIASDYEFLPEGVRVFKNLFHQRINKEEIFAKVEYERSGHVFEITCALPDFGQVWKVAHNLYTDLIETERGDEEDNFQSNLIATIIPGPDGVDKWAEPVGGSMTGSEELISLDFISVWKCQIQDLSMDKIIPKHVQLGIEIITCTKLVEDLNTQVIHVRAQCQEDCDKAIHKLDILRKYHDLARRHVSHLFFTEEKDHYEVCIKSLPQIKKKLVETTLLDPVYATCRYEELIRACTIRCCPFLHVRSAFLMKSGEKLIPAVPESKKGMAFDLWSGYRYPGIGDVSLKHAGAKEFRLPSVGPLETAENIRKWLATGIPDDINETIEQMKEDIQQAEKIGISSSDSLNDADFNRMRANIVVQETEQSFIKSSAGNSLGSVINNIVALRPAAEIKEFLDIPPSKRSIYRSPRAHDLQTVRTSRSENIRVPDVSKSLLDSDIQEDERISLSSIAFSAPLTTMLGSSADNNANNHGLEFFMNPYCSQSLLDNDIPESDRRGLKSARNGEVLCLGGHGTSDTTLPTIREETEVKSRVFHQTMRQGASRGEKGKGRASESPPATKVDKDKGRAFPSTPAPVAFADLDLKKSTKEFSDETEANAHTILTSLRNYNGEISLKCHFGRMLIKPFAASVMHSLGKAYSLPAENVCDLLLKNPRKVNFTKAVTNLPADIEFLINMSIDETNQRIWGDAVEWTVTYEFICCDHEDYDGICEPEFVIEMDADSFETKVKSAPINFGDLNVHCTLRNWDYLISATGSRNLEEDYGDLVQAIKESTYIAPGSEEVSMSFELSPRYQIHFQSIRVLRHSQYKSYDSKTLLNVMEVHNLDFNWEEGENGTMFFVTNSAKPNSVWHEINLESVEAKAAFSDNLNLELAEETEWTADLLLKSGVVVKDICIPANYIITKMDGVGFYNDNGTKSLLADADSIASTRLQHEKRSRYQFW